MNQSISYPMYAINFPKYWLLRDEPSNKSYAKASDESARTLLFHLEKGDYLSTVATILKFFEETIGEENKSEEMKSLQFKVLQNTVKDLLYVEKNYSIVAKDNKQVE